MDTRYGTAFSETIGYHKASPTIEKTIGVIIENGHHVRVVNISKGNLEGREKKSNLFSCPFQISQLAAREIQTRPKGFDNQLAKPVVTNTIHLFVPSSRQPFHCNVVILFMIWKPGGFHFETPCLERAVPLYYFWQPLPSSWNRSGAKTGVSRHFKA